MSAKLYVKWASLLERLDLLERSRIGKVQLSLNSSTDPSRCLVPLYQILEAVCLIPVCLMSACHWSLVVLYSSRCSRGMRKNKWSSTHLSRGPMPLARSISAPASATCPYAPHEGNAPNATHVSTHAVVSDIRTTAAGHCARAAESCSMPPLCRVSLPVILQGGVKLTGRLLKTFPRCKERDPW